MVAEAVEQAATVEPGSPVEPIPPHLVVPRARNLVGRGFDLVLATTLDLRPVSLTIAVQFLGTVGPLLFLFLALDLLAPQLWDSAMSETAILMTSDEATAWTVIGGAMIVAVLGLIVVLVEGQAMAMALLGGRLVGRPLSFDAALVRSRQVFWRLIRAGIIVGIPLSIVNFTMSFALAEAIGPVEAATLVPSIAVAILGVPFSYAASGIVLGDVAALDAVRRSVRLFRARPSLGFVLAGYAVAANVIAFFALGAGGDVLLRLASLFGLGFEGSLVASMATVVVVAVAVLAMGSLLFTVNAVILAPQVVAFVGLTHVSPGLERARRALEPRVATEVPSSSWGRGLEVGQRPSTRWLSIPMALLIVGGVVLLVSGLVMFSRLG